MTAHFIVPLQCLPSNVFCNFLHAHLFALNTTNSFIIFPPSSSFIMSTSFLFFPIGKALLSSFEYPFASNLIYVFAIFLSKSSALSHAQNCLYTCSIALTYFHTSTAFSHNRIHTLTSSLGPIILAQGMLAYSS